MPEELSLARAREPPHSALTSGSATGALPNGSPGHHLDHSQSRGVHTSSQRQTGDHALPRSGGWTNHDKFSGKPKEIPRKQAQRASGDISRDKTRQLATLQEWI